MVASHSRSPETTPATVSCGLIPRCVCVYACVRIPWAWDGLDGRFFGFGVHASEAAQLFMMLFRIEAVSLNACHANTWLSVRLNVWDMKRVAHVRISIIRDRCGYAACRR